MELRTLRSFVVLAEEQHFHRAADRLHIAQPALSQQIKRLEKDLGAQLFARTTRRVDLTDAGRVLLAEARRVLASSERARSAVAHAASGELGSVRIGFVTSAATGLVPSILLAVRERWPRLELELVEATTGEQLEAFAAGELDVGIVREVLPDPTLRITTLVVERLVAAVHASHPLSGRGAVALSELRGETFVALPRSSAPLLTDHVAGLCAAAGFHQDVGHVARQFATILGLVSASLGVAIVPESLRALRLPDLVHLDLTDPGAVSTVSVVTTQERAGSALVRNVVAAITGSREQQRSAERSP